MNKFIFLLLLVLSSSLVSAKQSKRIFDYEFAPGKEINPPDSKIHRPSDIDSSNVHQAQVGESNIHKPSDIDSSDVHQAQVGESNIHKPSEIESSKVHQAQVGESSVHKIETISKSNDHQVQLAESENHKVELNEEANTKKINSDFMGNFPELITDIDTALNLIHEPTQGSVHEPKAPDIKIFDKNQ